MYIHCSLLFVVLTISWLSRAYSYMNSSNMALLDQLTKSCPGGGIPVCGIRDKQIVLFSNDCFMKKVNKDILQGETMFRKIPMQHCVYRCQFPCSKIYNPVCARNKNTYQKKLFRNECTLTKYVCKTNMEYLKINLYECLPQTNLKNSNKLLQKRDQSTKRKLQPIPCTKLLKPVCGSYLGVKSSFRNECLLNAENVAYNREWRIINDGMCPQDYTNTLRHKEMPPKAHSIKRRSYPYNLYNQYQNEHEYNSKNYLDNTNQMNVFPLELYDYMPSMFSEQFYKNNVASYQNSIPVLKAYQVIPNRHTLPIADMSSFIIEESKKIVETITEKPTIKHFFDRKLAPDLNGQANKNYYYSFEKLDPNVKMDDMKEMSTAVAYIETTEKPKINDATIRSPKVFNKQKQGVTQQSTECKFGSIAICAAQADGVLKTFKTICEMMTANVRLKKTWTKLHDGNCENCKLKCLRDYQPVCISRNRVNYTIVNECYYKMAICMDKKSKWQKLSDGECQHYSRIPFKYANSKPGF